ncbi:MAG TPA: nickel pincer cofactor biosynthesis protein LarB [Chloroflexota bacterium]|nr:nickel pincer cofactor biosynthesis protein LarB [Chloroflexota bacterium]
MDEQRLRELLTAVASGAVGLDAALERLKDLPYEDLGFAKLDLHRELRRGFAEVIFGERKSPEQIVSIAGHLAARHNVVLATRLAVDAGEALRQRLPNVEYHPEARLVAIVQDASKIDHSGDVVVLSAGTADLQVAEEAALTAHYMGNCVTRIYDVGISALQRLLDQRKRLNEARVIVVVAGMDAALAAVTAGLVERPVIAVPTSVGYGAAFGGVAPLLTMLNACSSGVGVVNIDNGFGAAYLASLINKLAP